MGRCSRAGAWRRRKRASRPLGLSGARPALRSGFGCRQGQTLEGSRGSILSLGHMPANGNLQAPNVSSSRSLQFQAARGGQGGGRRRRQRRVGGGKGRRGRGRGTRGGFANSTARPEPRHANRCGLKLSLSAASLASGAGAGRMGALDAALRNSRPPIAHEVGLPRSQALLRTGRADARPRKQIKPDEVSRCVTSNETTTTTQTQLQGSLKSSSRSQQEMQNKLEHFSPRQLDVAQLNSYPPLGLRMAASMVATRMLPSNRYSPLNSKQEQNDKMQLIKGASRFFDWHWDENEKSPECDVGESKRNVCLHPFCSVSTAAIRGSKPFPRNGNYYYWEVTVLEKTYGTSVMFGVCTKNQLLHIDDYCNLIGLDSEGWSLSHKGLIWHDGKFSIFSQPFPQNQTITVGMLLNTERGELSYFMDGKCLGVAFKGLNDVEGELYPVVASTSRLTRMELSATFAGYETTLFEKSCFTILKHFKEKTHLINHLNRHNVPNSLIRYLIDVGNYADIDDNNNNCKSSSSNISMELVTVDNRNSWPVSNTCNLKL